MLMRPLGLLASLVLVLGVSACGGDSDQAVDPGGSEERTHEPQPEDPDGAACDYVPDGDAAKDAEPPAATAAYDGTVDVTLELSAGDVVATLDAASAPCTVSSFTSLTSQGYYDETPCHRLTTEGIFVLQCGDPSGSGSGGPGYSYADELTGSETYPAGTLAMANAGPDTNGSQFFVVYEETPLPPSYTVFGTIDEGLDVVQGIAETGVEGGGSDGAPAEEVTLDYVEVGAATAGTGTGTAPESSAPAASSCDYTQGGEAARNVDLPPTEPTATGDVEVTIATTAGDIGATLDGAGTPCTVNSFTSLAGQGYFDDTPCPRISDEGLFILQCGDPSGTGAGGPGYTFADELTGSETYPAGTLAMANAGPDTNGSQFFVVYEDSQLAPSYTVFGTIDQAGLDVVTAVAADGNDGSNPAGGGKPNTPIDITAVTVEE